MGPPFDVKFGTCDRCGDSASVAAIGAARVCRRCLTDGAEAITLAGKLAGTVAKYCAGCGAACWCLR